MAVDTTSGTRGMQRAMAGVSTVVIRGSMVGLCLLGLLLGGGNPAARRTAAARVDGVRAGLVVAPNRPTGALGPLLTIAQTWNNCGPASVAEVLSYWGVWRTQGQVQSVLRVDGLQRGMTPFGVPLYARSLGLRALVGVAGTQRLLKALISNGFPVIVSQWVSLSYHVGHYRPIDAYDDRQGVFVASDPYLGAGHRITYADFAPLWATTNGRFIVLYPPARQPLLTAVLASAGWDSARAYRSDLARMRARLRLASPPPPSWAVPGYRYLGLAWDEVQLGQDSAARRDLALATQQGANPIVVGWVGQAMARS